MKRILCLLLVMCSLVSFVACGKDDSGSKATEPSKSASSTSTTGASGEESAAPSDDTAVTDDVEASATADASGAPSATSGTSNGTSTAKPSGSNAPAPTGNNTTAKYPNWTLQSGDSKITVMVKNNVPYITYLATKASNKNVIDGESKMFLPDQYVSSGTKSFSWKYKSGSLSNNVLTLNFEDAAGYAYTSVIEASTKYAGPFEITGTFKNNTGTSITYMDEQVFAANFAMPKQTTAWTVAKESGTAEGVKVSIVSPGGKVEDAAIHNQPGTGIYKTVMSSGARVSIFTSPRNEWNHSGSIPIIYFDSSSTSGAYIALEWTEGGLEAKGNSGNKINASIRLSTGVAFGTKVPSKKTLGIPTTYIGVYDGDIEDGSNTFKRWFYNVKAPASLRENKLEPLAQIDRSWQSAEEYGFQAVKWDTNWWAGSPVAAGKPGAGFATLEGSWVVRKNDGYSNYGWGYDILRANNCLKSDGSPDLKKYTDLLKSKGLTLTMYILLHESLDSNGNPASEGLTSAGGRDSWFSDRRITSGRSADLGNEDCVAFIKTELTKFFKESGSTTWRTDMEPITIQSSQTNRHMKNGRDIIYWNTVGFYEIVDHLLENVPGFRYESCVCGGAMKDFATLSRASIVNNDDSADYNSLRTTFYDSSYCIPAAQLSSPCNVNTFNESSRHYTGPGDGDFGMRSIMMGAVQVFTWSDSFESDLMKKHMKVYNEKIKPLVRDADLYHILPRPDGKNWDGIQYADADSSNAIKGCVFVFKPSAQAGNTKTIKLRGLYADKTYTITSEDGNFSPITKTGKELMNTGITLNYTQAVTSDILWITQK